MKTITDKHHSWLLKNFHTLCSKLELDDDIKRGLIVSCGQESSKDLTVSDLTGLIQKLEIQLDPKALELDVWRKRVMASVGGYLKLINVDVNPQKIKAIACRATEFNQFNDIPKSRLRNIYNEFLRKQKDFESVDLLTKDELNILAYQN